VSSPILPERSSPALVLTIALLQGIFLCALSRSEAMGDWPYSSPATFYATHLCALLLPPVAYLLADWMSRRLTWVFLGSLGVVLLAIGAHHGLRVVGTAPRSEFGRNDGAFFLHVASIMLLVHVVPLLQARLSSGRWWPKYVDLFQYAWRDGIVVALTVAVSLVSWFLLWVWAQLFRMLGIRFFEIVFFRSPEVAWYLTAVIAGVAFLLVCGTEKLHATVRTLALTLLKWLAVLAAFVLVIFAIGLLFRAQPLFASHRHAISAAWLLTLALSVIYLYNAAYQDGSVADPYPRIVGAALRFAAPLLVVVSGLALFGIWIRVDQYGLTVPRVLSVIVGAITLWYGAGYAWAATRRPSWMGGIGHINTSAALLIVATLLLVLTPVLTPFRIAAASMERRILAAPFKHDGTLDAGPFSALRFDTGEYGRERLGRLQTIAGHAEGDVIRRAATQMAAETNRWAYPSLAASDPAFVTHPDGVAVDPGLKKLLLSESQNLCRSASHCVVHLLFVELRDDGHSRVVATTPSSTAIYLKLGDRWIAGGAGYTADESCLDDAKLADILQRGDYETVAPAARDLRIGARTYRFQDESRLFRSRGRPCPCESDHKPNCGRSAADASDEWPDP
jgi:hypothetical protein